MQPNGQAFFFVYVSVYFISRFRGKKNDFFDFFEREEDSSLTIIAFNSALLFYSGFPNRKLNAQVLESNHSGMNSAEWELRKGDNPILGPVVEGISHFLLGQYASFH